MKIAWFCIPAHGHTNPTLAVVKELTEAGHEVYYFSFSPFQKQIEQAGAVFIGCDDCDLVMEDKGNGDRAGKDLAFAAELLVSSTLALDDMAAEKIREIQPDLIVADSVAYWGKLTALKYGIPYVSSTTTFAFNRHSSKYMQDSPWEVLKMIAAMPRLNKQVRRLQEKGYPVRNLLDIIQNDNDTNTIVYTSPYFQPCADTFSDRYHFIGPSIRKVTQPMEKTAGTTVYVSLGTVNQNEDFYRDCIQALGQTDWQVIVALGENQIQLDNIPPNVQVHKTVDQMAVLEIADAFITHCGMNSVSEALYFRVPLVLVPQTPEQKAVARRTEELGAGIVLKQKDDIVSVIEKLLTDPAYKEKAARISDSFKGCGGPKEAKNFLEQTVNERRL